jgi:hypothetical protein
MAFLCIQPQPLKYRCTAAKNNGTVPVPYCTVPFATVTFRYRTVPYDTRYRPDTDQVPTSIYGNMYILGTKQLPTRYLQGTYQVSTRYLPGTYKVT